MRGWVAALVAAALFQLWDGRTLEVKEFIQHGDEYVVTLGDGTTLIVRQQEVREIVPVPAPTGASPAVGGDRDAGRR